MVVRVRRRARQYDWGDLNSSFGFGFGRTKLPPKCDADVSYLRNLIYVEFAE
jgi:hypothetical protein